MRQHARPLAVGIGFLLCALLLTGLGGDVAEAVKLEYRIKGDGKTTEKPRSSSEWKLVLDMLMTLLSGDEEFKQIAHEEMAKGTPIDFCALTMVTCNAEGVIEGLEIADVNGTVDFGAVPETVGSLSFVRGIFQQDADLSALPWHITSVKFDGSRFNSTRSGPRHVILALSNSNTGLQHFTCRNCSITDVDAESLPTLLSLDISGNPLKVPREIGIPTLHSLNVSGCEVDEPLGEWVSRLPSTLTSLDASGCSLSGTLAEVSLPHHLEVLVLSNNSLTGVLSSANLPQTLVKLVLAGNRFSGGLDDLKALRELQELDISRNAFTVITWEKLPAKLQRFIANNNRIAGTLSYIPPSLVVLDVANNAMTGSIALDKLPAQLATLDIQSNKFNGEVNFDRIGPAARFIFMQNNEFTGRCDLTNLPVELRRIVVAGNRWYSPLPPR